MPEPVPVDLPAPKLLVCEQFDNIDQLGAAGGWDLDFRQLEPGPLDSELLMFGHERLIVTFFRFNRAYHQLGNPPEGVLTFGIPDERIGPLIWSGAETPRRVLINFSHDRALDAVNPVGGSRGFVFSFDPRLLEEIRDAMGLPADVLGRAHEKRFWEPAKGMPFHVRDLLVTLEGVARSQGDEGLARWSDVFNYDLAAQLLTLLSGPEHKPRRVQPRFRARALDRAVALLASHDEMPESVETLCTVAGASWATLLRAFKDSFGVSPKTYMKVRRLTAVRHDLLIAEEKVRISDVANRWGFWHMGSFAADYRKQFGELPSETLRSIKK